MSAREHLLEMGFSGLEADAYICLLSMSPATGYKVAKGISKPTANTYKALESLLSKGAIAAETGKRRMYRALPPDEVFDAFENRFRDRRTRAQKALRNVGSMMDDDRVYHLESAEQYFTRFRNLLEECREMALVDTFPVPLARIQKDLQRAAERGVRIAVKVYEPVKDPNKSITYIEERISQVPQRWPGQWCNGVFDGRRHIMGLLTDDLTGVHQALWSSSCYVSWVYHSSLSSEILLSATKTALAEGKGMKHFSDLLKKLDWVQGLELPGYHELNRRYRTADKNPTSEK